MFLEKFIYDLAVCLIGQLIINQFNVRNREKWFQLFQTTRFHLLIFLIKNIIRFEVLIYNVNWSRIYHKGLFLFEMFTFYESLRLKVNGYYL